MRSQRVQSKEVRMSDDVSINTLTAPPPVTLLQMMTGYWVSQSIYVAAKLNLADLHRRQARQL